MCSELGVLLEITWNVLRPVHVSLPQGVLKVFIGITVLAIVGGALLAWHFDPLNGRTNDLKDPLDLTVGLLRMLIFALTASFAQMLGIGWKNKVLQLGDRPVFLQCRRPGHQPDGANFWPLRQPGTRTRRRLRPGTRFSGLRLYN